MIIYLVPLFAVCAYLFILIHSEIFSSSIFAFWTSSSVSLADIVVCVSSAYMLVDEHCRQFS